MYMIKEKDAGIFCERDLYLTFSILPFEKLKQDFVL